MANVCFRCVLEVTGIWNALEHRANDCAESSQETKHRQSKENIQIGCLRLLLDRNH